MQKSFVLGVCVGESFAEYTLLSDSAPVAQKRVYHSRENLKQSLQQFVTQNAPSALTAAFITLRLPKKLLDFQPGSSIAHVTTAGFEHWLQICGSESQDLNSKGFLFSVSERILANGTIETPLEATELESLAQKLTEAGKKKVCLHLLHSVTNPTHLHLATTFLTSKGFEVFVPENSDAPDEIKRWNKNALKANLAGVFTERKDELTSALEGLVDAQKIYFLDSAGRPILSQNMQELECFFSSSTLLGLAFGGKEKFDVLHLGLENFSLISSRQWSSTWQSPWGPVELAHLDCQELKVQPTSGVALNSLGRFDFTTHQEGWEPGPMFIGRGQKPTLLDLWADNAKLAKVEGLEDRISPQGLQRFKNSLFALAKISASKENEVPHITKELQSLALQRLAMEAVLHRQSSKMIVTGPLSPVFANIFKKDPHAVIDSQEFSESFAAALCGQQALKEIL